MYHAGDLSGCCLRQLQLLKLLTITSWGVLHGTACVAWNYIQRYNLQPQTASLLTKEVLGWWNHLTSHAGVMRQGAVDSRPVQQCVHSPQHIAVTHGLNLGVHNVFASAWTACAVNPGEALMHQ